MIDLHMHSTVSDGRLTPSELMGHAHAAGLTVVSLTDHDTTAGLDEAAAAARALSMTFVPGIEITAVESSQDVHVLGYFFDPADRGLRTFLRRQRADRIRRLRAIGERLRALAAPIDVGAVIARAGEGSSVGRPHVADELVAAGHALDRNDAFERLLGRGRPAFAPRTGARAVEVVEVIRAAGGIASLAHPGLTKRDDLIAAMAERGLAALEARHSEHGPETEAHYRALAARHGLAVSGGSDFHDPAGSHHIRCLGVVTLPADDFEALRSCRNDANR